MFNFGHWRSRLQHCVVLVACGVCIPGIVRAEESKQQAMKGMQVTVNEAQRRVDITFDGLPFTSYIWPTSLKKPVLYPLTAPGGVIVSRGWPLEPRPKERVDHPHQVGMWFNYGNINGIDFWNNSDAIKPEVREKYGTIHQERIVSTRSGPTSCEFVVQTVWTTGKGQDIIKETTRFIFLHRSNANVIDRITTLTALDHLVFHDDKEGLFGMRVAHFLESADEKAGLYMDSSGNATKVANGDTTGATGVYLTSEDKQDDAAWGTRGRWCILRGKTADSRSLPRYSITRLIPAIQPTGWFADMGLPALTRLLIASLIPRLRCTTLPLRRVPAPRSVIESSSTASRRLQRKRTRRAMRFQLSTSRNPRQDREQRIRHYAK